MSQSAASANGAPPMIGLMNIDGIKEFFRPLEVAAPGFPEIDDKVLYGKKDLRGRPMPKLKVEQWITPEPDLEGKVLLLDFWATWCGPCRAGIPKLQDWQKKFGDDLVIIGLSPEPAQTILDAFKGGAPGYTLARDSQKRTFEEVGVKGVPHVLLASPDGIVRWQGFPADPKAPLTERVIRQVIEASRGRA